VRAPAKTSAALGRAAPEPAWSSSAATAAPGEDWNTEFVAYERQRLVDALSEAGGNKSVAARLLGMPRSTFFSKIKKYGIV
jgi:transcriptional regulator of acetoin/glycerol metabolism